MLAVSAPAAAPLSFSSTFEAAEEGVKFKVPADAVSRPPAQPAARYLRYSDGRTLEVYDPRALWVSGQFLGQWTLAAGGGFTVFAVRSPFPNLSPSQAVTRADFAAAAATAAAAPGPVEVTAWLADLTQGQLGGSPRRLPDTLRLQDLQVFEGEASLNRRAAYALSLKPVPGDDRPHRLVALFEAPAGTFSNVARVVEREFLASVERLPRGRALRPAGPPGATSGAAAAAAASADPEFVQSRQETLNSIRGLDGWWSVESRRFVVVSDLPGIRRQFVQRLQEELEILRQAHEVVLPPRQPIRACSAVRIFAERAAYEKHVGPEAKWSGGLWVPRMRELVISAPEQAGGARMKEIVADVVYHEATHQYIFYALNKNDPAVWFNEGLAEFFEMARLTRTGVSFEENDDHRERVLKMIKGGKADLAAFMAIDYPAFYDAENQDDEPRRNHYALAWSIQYYLLKGAPLERPAAAAALFDRYAAAVGSGTNEFEALQSVLAPLTLPELQKSFTAFWTSPSKRMAARGYDVVAERRKRAAAPAAR